jgi:hypothetical protein
MLYMYRIALIFLILFCQSSFGQTLGTFKAEAPNKATALEKLTLNKDRSADVIHSEIIFRQASSTKTDERIVRKTRGTYKELTVQEAISRMDSPDSKQGLNKLKDIEEKGYNFIVIVTYSTSQSYEKTFLGASNGSEIVCLNTGEVMKKVGWLW